MRSNPFRATWLFFLILIIGFLSFQEIFSQTSAPFNNATLPRHHTLDQRTIEVVFSLALTGNTNTGQWTVRIGGSAVGIVITGLSTTGVAPGVASISPVGTQVFVHFDASGFAGHGAGKPYLFPGEVLTVSYAGATLTTASNGNVVANFGPITSKNTYVPPGGAGATGSVDLRPISEGPLIGTDQCSPVNTNFYRWSAATHVVLLTKRKL